ncbi:MAG: heat-inducible transcriptional repressor HrcA [Chloroflexi bacterium]|nr:heat-inducible transcriptional repressor HrcA [Chloroflexota bacterium]
MARRKDRDPGPLDTRALAILQTIIEEYVVTATPVGSHALVERHGLDISSATVRNIMAELERAGYLSHPHTSAGRTPTDAGYRMYVTSVADGLTLAPVEQLMIRHQFGQVEFTSEQWFRLAAATLAKVTREAGLATPAKPATARLRRLDLVQAGDRIAALVLVLAEGQVKQCLLQVGESSSQEVLDTAARRLNELLAGRTTRQVERTVSTMEARADEAADGATERVVRMGAARALLVMREFDAAAVEDMVSEGLLNVLAAPEFAESEKVRRVFGVLQDREYLGRLVRRVAGHAGVQVFIGSENEVEEMRDVSLVVSSYGRPGRAVGLVGVLGPTRMPYPHAIGTVRYVSGLLSELVDHFYV